MHRVQNQPQVLSTSRHIAQGALDITALTYDAEKRVLTGVSQAVGGEPYEVVVAMPQELRVFGEGNHTTTNELEYLADNICRCTFHPEQNGPFRWEIAFTPRTR